MKINLKIKIFYLAIAVICLISISGAVIYYLYALNWLGISLTLTLSGGGLYFFIRLLFNKKSNSISLDDIADKFIEKKTKIDWKKITTTSIWPLAYLLLLTLCSMFLFQARTDQALTSPWQIVSTKFFITYVLATAYLFFLTIKNFRFTLWLIVLHYLLSFSVLWIIFKIGYGYDPFIHQATISLIDKQGFITPKTPYYLGQYSLILIAHKLFSIPIVWADKLLVPALTALTLPITINLFLKKAYSNSSFIIHHLSLIVLLILPFSIFTLTVPQNLAYLFLILTIFFSLTASNRTENILSGLLAITALAIHPIAGLPAIFFIIALTIYRLPTNFSNFLQKKSVKNIFYSLFFILNAISLPAIFWLTQKDGSQTDATKSAAIFKIPAILFPQRENIFLNFIYFFQNNLWFILILISALVAYIIYRYRQKYPALIITAGSALSLLLGYFLTRQINFNALISYERDDYANRILMIAFIFLLPTIVLIFCKLLSRILASSSWLKYSWLTFLALLITASLYCSYPRLDNCFNSHGFSVGQNDLAAVNLIEKDANGEPYVVLANQQVSVGALWTFGFSHYYKNDIFFYPIPTGGPLYQIYLKMVYEKADRDTALKAADLTGVKTVYFVINKYWTGFDKIVEQAKMEATSYKSLNNGDIYIFTYTK